MRPAGCDDPAGTYIGTLYCGRCDMSRHRYWVNVRQTAHMQKCDTTSVSAPTLATAEGRAVALLRVARLTKTDGALWDRWEVKTSGSPHALPQLVAYGDHLHTLYTRRDHGWVD